MMNPTDQDFPSSFLLATNLTLGTFNLRDRVSNTDQEITLDFWFQWSLTVLLLFMRVSSFIVAGSFVNRSVISLTGMAPGSSLGT